MKTFTDQEWLQIIDKQIENLERRKFFGIISQETYDNEITKLNKDYNEVYQRAKRGK